MKFRESTYFAAFKSLRNRFRKFDSIALIQTALTWANSGSNEVEKAKKQPWLMLLLVKWVLMDDHFYSAGRPMPSRGEFLRLAQQVQDLSDKTRPLNEYDDLHLWLRSMATQQFWLQQGFSHADFARQYVLFGDLEPDHRIRVKFREITGLEIREFLDCSMVLLTRFFSEEHLSVSESYFTDTWFAKSGLFPRYMNVCSTDLSHLRDWLLATQSSYRPSDEYYEQTPLLANPLLRIDSNYWTYHPKVLFRSLENFIYDNAKSEDPQSFMAAFGELFERHVESAIKITELAYVTESQLKAEHGKRTGKLVDFIIQDGTSNIFLDVKGVSSTHRVMTTHSSEILKDRTKEYALKAIDQALDVQTWLENGSAYEHNLHAANENFLVVVTYKDLYLGNGRVFAQISGQDAVAAIFEKYSSDSNLPLENIYFLPIEDFELLCQAVGNGEIGLGEALRKAREADRSYQTMKFNFRLHLGAWNIDLRMLAPNATRIELELSRISKMLQMN